MNDFLEREFSTCASTLRLLLKRRKNSSLAHNSEEKNNRIVDKDRTFTHLMKTPNRASGNTRMNVHQIKPSEIKVFARNCDSNLQKFQISKKCIYDSTRSYDPTLLIPCNGVVKFVEELLEKDTDSSKNKVPKNKNKSDCDTKICNASKSTIVSSTKNNYESIPSNKSRLKSDIKLSDLKSNTENNILESVKKSTSGKLIEGFKYSIEKSFNNGQVLHNKPDPQSNLKKKLQKLAENPKVNDLIDK